MPLTTRSPSAVCLGFFLFYSWRVAAADVIVPGAPSAPYPTLENIALEWPFSGDDDGDSRVSVRYRKLGQSEYLDGLALRRVRAGENAGFSWQSRFSGSVFGLDPGQSYEVELSLSDPDGVDQVVTVIADTLSIFGAAARRELPVTPETLADALTSAEPGDALILSPGIYGDIVVERDGAPGSPIGLRAGASEGVVVEGEIRLDGRAHIQLSGLDVHGRIKLNGARDILLRDLQIATAEDGVVAYEPVQNVVVWGNVISGSTEWKEQALGVDGDNIGEGVQLTGPGNVIAYNDVSGFRDCISLMESDEAVDQFSVDIYGNDLHECADDAVEADYAMGNVRVYKNRIRNSFMGISSQPSLGGPTYFFRNVMYNVLYEPFKLHNGTSGDIILHNTVVKSGDALAVYTDDAISDAVFRNNLFLGGPGRSYGDYDSGEGRVIELRSASSTCSLDYDGFGSIGTGIFRGHLGETAFEDFDSLRAGTTEVHAAQVNLTAFASEVPLPGDAFSLFAPPSLGLSRTGPAIDRGTPLPNINDSFAGDAPDLGAYEFGDDLPTYGPAGTMEPGLGGQGGQSSLASGGTAGSGGSGGRPSGAGSSAPAGAAPSATGGATGARGSEDPSGCACSLERRPRLDPALSLVILALAGTLRRRRALSYYVASGV